MSRALITTLAFYHNFGSVLQAYALKKTLEDRYALCADIFPYRPNIKEWQYFTEESLKKAYADKIKKFDAFRRDTLGMPAQSGGTVREAYEAMRHEPEEYDVHIAGSDIVWGKEFSGLEEPYFLMHASDHAKKVAYAASVILDENGHTEDDDRFMDRLGGFDAIGMRETSSVLPIQRFAKDIQVRSVLDPTLLLNAEDYETLVIETDEMRKSPYLLSYFLTHDPATVDYTNMIAKKLGLRVVHYFADYPDRIFASDAKCFAFAGPGEFLGYVKNADMVFTNSFHGTCFSMIYRKPFYTYMAKRNMLSRVRDTVERLGMQEQYFTDFRDLERVTLDIHYDVFEQNLTKEREKSFGFLKDALEM
jgi:hypothetical protein